MADLGAAVGPILELVGPLVRPAISAFLRTTFGMATLCLLAGVAAWFIAADGVLLRGALAVLLAVAVFAVLGAMLAAKRAVGGALLAGFRTLRLGEKTTGALFARVLKLHDGEAHGERGVDPARGAERLPLARAEALLNDAVNDLLRLSDGKAPGRVRRALQEAAVTRVRAVTLARFRDDAAAHGGVDLIKVRDELGAKVDQLVADTIEGALSKTTLLFVLLACGLSVAAAFGVRAVWI